MAYRDSIYDPLNDAGSAAILRLEHGALARACEAAVRGGNTPESLAGFVAGVAVLFHSDAVAWDGQSRPYDPTLAAVRLEAAAFLEDAVEDGVDPNEAVGFLLSSTMSCACKVSLELRFAPRENKESLLEAGSNE